MSKLSTKSLQQTHLKPKPKTLSHVLFSEKMSTEIRPILPQSIYRKLCILAYQNEPLMKPNSYCAMVLINHVDSCKVKP